MTDNEIIKALECCCKPAGEACEECPLNSQGADCLDFEVGKLVLDLIKRQQAEIERLKAFEKNVYETVKEIRNNIKAEAVKEFAERLKTKKHECGCNFRKKPVFAITEEKIDETYKEMVGES